MIVPSTCSDLDESDAALNEAARYEHFGAVGAYVFHRRGVGTRGWPHVFFAGRLALFGNVESIRRLGLHLERNFKRLNTGIKLIVLLECH